MPIRLERRYRFSASHLYRRPEWSDEENVRHFGKCANLPGHGHNYRLWVRVTGPVHSDTGFVVDLAELDRLVQAEVLDVIDHQHLNHALPEFAAGEKVPSSENLVDWVRRRLQPVLPSNVHLDSLRLEEDEDLACTWRADEG